MMLSTQKAGAQIIASADEVWAQADMIVKVKEPITAEYPRMREGQLLFTYLHLAPDTKLTAELLERKSPAWPTKRLLIAAVLCRC